MPSSPAGTCGRFLVSSRKAPAANAPLLLVLLSDGAPEALRPCLLPLGLPPPPLREDLGPLPRPCLPCLPWPRGFRSSPEDFSCTGLFFTFLPPRPVPEPEAPSPGESPSAAMISPAEDMPGGSSVGSGPPIPSAPPAKPPAGSGVSNWFVSFTFYFSFISPDQPELSEP